MPGNASGTWAGAVTDNIPYPLAGELVTGASVQQVAQAAANQDTQIRYAIGLLTAGTWDGILHIGNDEPTTLRIETGSNLDANGPATFDGTVTFNSRTRITGNKDLSDADHTLHDATTDGLQYIRMLTAPAANRFIKLPQPTAWAPSTAYTTTNPDFVSNDGGKLYECTTNGTSAGSGGPAGTGGSISDGSCVWAYRGIAPVTGDWIKLSAFVSNSAFSVQVKRSTSSEYLAFLGPGADVGDMATALFRYNGTKWKLLDVGGSAAEFGDESSDP